jgi:hypothetical protein
LFNFEGPASKAEHQKLNARKIWRLPDAGNLREPSQKRVGKPNWISET